MKCIYKKKERKKKLPSITPNGEKLNAFPLEQGEEQDKDASHHFYSTFIGGSVQSN